MGICQECRLRVNGQMRLACQIVCENGMHIQTGIAAPTP
jgi:succinate dehydrogenase/fumarate reductase-like Fe-S protein